MASVLPRVQNFVFLNIPENMLDMQSRTSYQLLYTIWEFLTINIHENLQSLECIYFNNDNYFIKC